ncbi:MAG: peptidoglycan -binding protein [Pseudomonadota bacterium]|nr:peptidoglycan -binding protein [Pseudomonadota bacterium]
MSHARLRRRGAVTDFWPGYVDAMATLLLVVTFLLSLFMLVQYFVTQESSGKDNALAILNKQIAQLTELLALERSGKRSLEDSVSTLSVTLDNSKEESRKLRGSIESEKGRTAEAEGRASSLATKLDEQVKIGAEALARVELLNQQLAALRRQIAALEEALEATEKREKESQTKISDLGKRLNIALAKKVQELSRYRSDFFGQLREVLGARDDIQIVGDRFVFQAEVLFDSGSAEINQGGLVEIDKLGQAIRQLEKQIPGDIAWVLRVDGHTDNRPINRVEFPSNWELSSARAIAVVKRLIDQGVSPRHLVAAGFGEHQPLASGNDDAALRRNRRIELKLTER